MLYTSFVSCPSLLQTGEQILLSSFEGEAKRKALNEWMRTSGEYDGVIDFDKVTRDPNSPGKFAAFADSGDHLHPGDAGYKAMGEAVDLALFR